MRKKVKWHRLQKKREKRVNTKLIEELRKLEQMMDVQLRSEKLKGVELKQNKVVGEEQVLCELEDGEMIPKTSVEAIEPYAFEINNLCTLVDVIHDDG